MTNATAEERLQLVGTHKHGSIRRVKLRNFLTYFDVEITPGPRLNMVVGPNGTGKSTILCAICLGLGGEPRLLGRASEVETFIANGEDEGEIEIELENTRGGTNPVIRRLIRRDQSPKSIFHWDGKQITGKAVKETCLTKYDISVDNLCTFLPQDRVGSFSGFDSKQLLIETEKALSASQDLYHTHQELIKDQEDLRGGDNQRETLEDKLNQLQQENKRLERAKDLMEERDKAVAQMDLLRKKMLWMEFDEKCEVAKSRKEAREELKAKLTEVMETVAPLEEEYKNAAARAAKLKEEWQECEAEIKACNSEMEKQIKKHENHDDAIEGNIQEIQSIDVTRHAKEKKLRDLQAKLSQLRETFKDAPSAESLMEEMKQCQEEVQSTKPAYDNAKREHQRLAEEHREVEDEYKQVAAKMEKLKNEKARRNERIFRQQPDLAKISEWLSKNRSMFRKPVVGPVMCEITTKSETTASYLEQHVPNAVLKSYIVQCKEDYDLLYRSIREEQGIPINVTVVKEIKPVNRFYSDEMMEVLKGQHGVLGYLDECIEAPANVLEALRSAALIDKVLVGSDKTQDSLDNRGLFDFLAQPEDGSDKLRASVIFTSQGNKSFKYTTIISKYGEKKPSTRIDTIRPAKFLAPGVSEDAKNKVAAELAEHEKRLSEVRPAVEQAERAVTEASLKAQEARARLNAARENMSNVRRMENKVRNAEAKALEAEKELEGNDEDEKRKLVSELGKRLRHSLAAVEAHAVGYEKMMQATIKAAGARLNYEPAKVEEQRLTYLLQEAREECKAIEVEYHRAVTDYKAAVQECKKAQAVAKREAPIQDENGDPTPLRAKLEELGVETYAEAAEALDEAERKVQGIHADNNAIASYERNKEELEEVQAQLDDLVSFEEKRREELDAKVKPWEQRLVAAVSKVDVLFGKYMAEMGNTGEVALVRGETTEEMPYGNFKDWGIEIRVSFRDNLKMQVLSARVQSGGERSVSTIMYLMALQGLMVSPFRCVDEINQGLDERNERLVFRRIVTNSTLPPGRSGLTDHSGQYFLITPKLLPNLYDMEVEAMTVLFIFNGPYNVKNPKDFDIANLLSLRKRAIESTEAAEDDENTPNSERAPAKKQARRSLSSRASVETTGE